MAILGSVILGIFFLQFGLAMDEKKFCSTLSIGDISLNETCPCDDVKKPYNLNCNKYYECVNGDLYLKDCGTGKIFDENAQTCLPTSKAKCAPDPSFGAEGWIGSKCFSEGGKLKQNGWNCHKYFQCAPVGLIMNECAGNLYFDETIQTCTDWPSDTSFCDPCIGRNVSYLYGVGFDDHVYRTSAAGGSWIKFNSANIEHLKKIIIREEESTGANIIYGIGTDRAVYQNSAKPGGEWTKVAPPYVTDLAYSNGYLYAVGPLTPSMPTSGNQVWRTVPNEGSSWSKFTDGDVSKIIIHEDIMYAIGRTDNAVYQNSATHESWGWAKVAPPSVTDLAYSNGYLYGVGKNQVWRIQPCKLCSNTWTKFTDDGAVGVTKIIIHGDIIYGIGSDDQFSHAVYQTSAISGGPWTKITNPYVIDLAYSNGFL